MLLVYIAKKTDKISQVKFRLYFDQKKTLLPSFWSTNNSGNINKKQIIVSFITTNQNICGKLYIYLYIYITCMCRYIPYISWCMCVHIYIYVCIRMYVCIYTYVCLVCLNILVISYVFPLDIPIHINALVHKAELVALFTL